VSRLTVLSWRRRLVCGGCGARSSRRSLVGELMATPAGWRCPACWEQSQVDNPPLCDFEPAPRHAPIAPGDTPVEGVAA
jgi:hypothetical protein